MIIKKTNLPAAGATKFPLLVEHEPTGDIILLFAQQLEGGRAFNLTKGVMTQFDTISKECRGIAPGYGVTLINE